MNKRIIIGPGTPSVLLAAVVAIISVLTLLAASAARQDEQLSDRMIHFRQDEYRIMADAQERLAQLDAVLAECGAASADDEDYLKRIAGTLPNGMALTERLISWTEKPDIGRALACEIEIMPLGSAERYSWRTHSLLPDAAIFEQEEFE